MRRDEIVCVAVVPKREAATQAVVWSLPAAVWSVPFVLWPGTSQAIAVRPPNNNNTNTARPPPTVCVRPSGAIIA